MNFALWYFNPEAYNLHLQISQQHTSSFVVSSTMSSSACNTMKVQKVEMPSIHPGTSHMRGNRSAIQATPQPARHWATVKCNVIVPLVCVVSFHCSRVTEASSKQRYSSSYYLFVKLILQRLQPDSFPIYCICFIFTRFTIKSMQNTEMQRHIHDMHNMNFTVHCI